MVRIADSHPDGASLTRSDADVVSVDSGRSAIVIEHCHAVMPHARYPLDRAIDIGPAPVMTAGCPPGGIVFEGTRAQLVAARSTLTGEHLAAYVGS